MDLTELIQKSGITTTEQFPIVSRSYCYYLPVTLFQRVLTNCGCGRTFHPTTRPAAKATTTLNVINDSIFISFLCKWRDFCVRFPPNPVRAAHSTFRFSGGGSKYVDPPVIFSGGFCCQVPPNPD